MERITINDLIEELQKVPKSQRNKPLEGIGTLHNDGKYFYRFHIGGKLSGYYDVLETKEIKRV